MPHGARLRRQFATLASGTTFAALLPLVVSPILTRLYEPADFGFLALFVSITAFFAVLVTGRYETAIVLPQQDSDAVHLARGAMTLTSVSCLALAVLYVLLSHLDVPMGPLGDLGSVALLSPIAIWLAAVSAVLSMYAVRRGNFGSVTGSLVVKSTSATALQIALGLLRTPIGLVWGQVASLLFGSSYLFREFRKSSRTFPISISAMRAQMRTYSDFPKYSIWATLAAAAGAPLLNTATASIYSLSTLGALAMAQRFMSLPSGLVGEALALIFLREASESRKEGRSVLALYDRLVRLTAMASAPFFLVGAIFAPAIFGFVFGPDWVVAGEAARLLAPVGWASLSVAPILNTASAFERQRLALFWQSFRLSVLALCVLGAATLEWSFTTFLLTYSLSAAACYVLVYVLYRKVVATAA